MSIVVTSGGFDPLHAGHIEYLRRTARWSANKHICIVNSDDFLEKKKGYHVMNWVDRMTIVGALKYVDEVMPAIDEDQSVCETLRLIRAQYPDDIIYFLKGGDKNRDNIPEAAVCDELNIYIADNQGDKVRSSQSIIEEVFKMSKVMEGPSEVQKILDTEYCKEFDEKRKNAILVSFHKYGPAKENFQEGMVDAIGSLKKNLKKFEKTGNTEYLVDVANYAMFRYMYPIKGESYRPTDSDQSAGVDGMTINEMKKFQEEHKYE